MNKLILFLSTLLSLNSIASPLFSYYLELESTGDFVSEIEISDYERDGWIIETNNWDEPIFTLGKINIPYNEKTINESIGDINFTIRRTQRGAYESCLGIAVGDFDSSAEGCSYLHKGVNVITTEGGDHASGGWGISGKAVIHWK